MARMVERMNDFDKCPRLIYLHDTTAFNPLLNIAAVLQYTTPREMWDFLCFRYGEHRILETFLSFTTDVFGSYKVYESQVQLALSLMFEANKAKYDKLLQTTSPYDMFSPYHIKEEHVTGNKAGSVTNTNGTTITETQMESSYNDTDPSVAGKTITSPSGSNSVSYSSDKSETFESGTDGQKTLSGMSSTSKSLDSRVGNIGNHTYADIVDKERKMANFSLMDEIAKDIVKEICYKIF